MAVRGSGRDGLVPRDRKWLERFVERGGTACSTSCHGWRVITCAWASHARFMPPRQASTIPLTTIVLTGKPCRGGPAGHLDFLA